MKKTIIFLLAPILLASCFGFNKTEKPENKPTNIQTGESIQDDSKNETQSWAAAISSLQTVVEDYWVNEIIAKKDVKLCASILDSAQKIFCINQINYNLAVEMGDYKYCALIRGSNMKNKCKEYLDKYFESNGKCDSITDANKKSICKMEDKLSNNQQVDQKTCSTITSVADKNKCFDYYYYNIVANNPSITSQAGCDVILNPTDKKNCYQLIDARKTKTTEAKETLGVKVDGSKNIPALEKKCAWVIGGKWKDDCLEKEYSKIAVEKKDITYCDVIVNSESAQGCKNYYHGLSDLEYFKNAKNNKDVSQCNNIQDELSKKQCITIVSSLK